MKMNKKTPIYLTKAEMIKKWKKNYFGLTHTNGLNTEIYIRSDLPECVQESVLGHEEHHAEGNHGEFGAWVAGFKANKLGFFLGILMSLSLSRLKMYPKLTSAILLVIGFSLLIYFNN